MGCSMNPPEPTRPATQPIAGDVPRVEAPSSSQDPFARLDDLMTVVEALCPRWPPRGGFRETAKNRL
jgi:hypothetical protein